MARILSQLRPKRSPRNWHAEPDWRARHFTPPRASRWFRIVLFVLPLIAFCAVFFAPEAGAQEVRDRQSGNFPICVGSGRITCVVDGDTIWFEGRKIRLADINTPEISRPKCAAEKRLGDRATLRLQDLLNQGAFTLAPNPSGRQTDRYGRELRVLMRGGVSLGEMLVQEGLAERWKGKRGSWC